MAPSAFERWRARQLFTPQNLGLGSRPITKAVTAGPPPIPLPSDRPISPSHDLQSEKDTRNDHSTTFGNSDETIETGLRDPPQNTTKNDSGNSTEVSGTHISTITTQQHSRNLDIQAEVGLMDKGTPTSNQSRRASRKRYTLSIVSEEGDDRIDTLTISSIGDDWFDYGSPNISPLPSDDEGDLARKRIKERTKRPASTIARLLKDSGITSGSQINPTNDQSGAQRPGQSDENGSDTETEYSKSEMSRLLSKVRSQTVQLRFLEALLHQEQEKAQNLQKQLRDEGAARVVSRKDRTNEASKGGDQVLESQLSKSWSEYQVLISRLRKVQAKLARDEKVKVEQEEELGKLRFLIRSRDNELKQTRIRESDANKQKDQLELQMNEIQKSHEQCEPSLAKAVESCKAELNILEEASKKTIQILEDRVKDRDTLIDEMVKREQATTSDVEGDTRVANLDSLYAKLLVGPEQLREAHSELAESRANRDRQARELEALEQLGRVQRGELDKTKQEREAERDQMATLTRTVNEELPELQKQKDLLQRQLAERDRTIREAQMQVEAMKMTIQEHIIVERREREELTEKYMELLREKQLKEKAELAERSHSHKSSSQLEQDNGNSQTRDDDLDLTQEEKSIWRD